MLPVFGVWGSDVGQFARERRRLLDRGFPLAPKPAGELPGGPSRKFKSADSKAHRAVALIEPLNVRPCRECRRLRVRMEGLVGWRQAGFDVARIGDIYRPAAALI